MDVGLIILLRDIGILRHIYYRF